MKGAAVGHAQQRYKEGRFYRHDRAVRSSPPSPPNPLVNELIIMPDIEKRLEAFARIAHGIIIFPGGRRYGGRAALSARDPDEPGQQKIRFCR